MINIFVTTSLKIIAIIIMYHKKGYSFFKSNMKRAVGTTARTS